MLCCAGGGALGALSGYFYGMTLHPPAPLLAGLYAGIGAVCGSFFYALIE